ncbi:MAG: aldehyde dehydrogenase family protein, partial [Paracoccus sp. (in: a-proteobacteria)]
MKDDHTREAADYTGFTGQFIAGHWVDGSAGTVQRDTNPYDDSLLTEITQADIGDLERAFAAAQTAQRDWATSLPATRAEIFYRARNILDRRRDEV